jgi:hypothetical protein
LAFIPKKINVIYQNSIETKVLNVKLFLDGKEIENNEIVYSYPFPKKSSRLSVNSGYHTIEIKCSELKIEKSVKVFTPFKNNIEFEFIGNAENGFDVIERNSWFDLVYE